MIDTLKLYEDLAESLREMVAELFDSVVYEMENRAIARLPAILEAEHGVRVEGRLVRRFVEYPEGGEDEVGNVLNVEMR